MSRSSIGVIGNGVVGGATARCYMEYAEVRVWDKVKEKCTHSLDEVLECGIVFICLPSPQKRGSLGCDTSVIDDFCNMLGGSNPTSNYVLKSTVPVGTTKRLKRLYGLKNLVHSPEFLTARCAVIDSQLPARNIIGSESGLGSCMVDTDLHRNPVVLHNLYAERFPGVPIHHMTSDESELVKLAVNSFFAVKIAYFNEVREFVDSLGLNWKSVINGILSDGRIAHSHTQVPGPDGKFGFGGACLPKDLASFYSQLSPAVGYVTGAAHRRNVGDRLRGIV